MSKITWKPGTMLAPVPPALISCGTVERPNVMTAAWTGIISSEPPMTYVSIRPSRFSHGLIKDSGEFVINLTTLPLAEAADFCGVKSGRDTDKFQAMHLTAAPCAKVKAPQVAESPVSIECKVKSIVNYGTHDMFLAEIVAVNVDDTYINDKGRLDLEKARLFGQQRTAEKKAKNAERKERKGVRRTNHRTAAAVFRRQTRGFKSAAQTLRQAESCQKSIKKRVCITQTRISIQSTYHDCR